MSCQDILHTYHKRMKREAMGKALVIGALSGLTVGSAIMGVSWLSTACEGRFSWLPPAFNGTLWAILAALLITGTSFAIWPIPRRAWMWSSSPKTTPPSLT